MAEVLYPFHSNESNMFDWTQLHSLGNDLMYPMEQQQQQQQQQQQHQQDVPAVSRPHQASLYNLDPSFDSFSFRHPVPSSAAQLTSEPPLSESQRTSPIMFSSMPPAAAVATSSSSRAPSVHEASQISDYAPRAPLDAQQRSAVHSAPHTPPERRSVTPLTSDATSMKRIYPSQEPWSYGNPDESIRSRKRRAYSAATEPLSTPTLKEEDKFLLQLKDGEHLPWREIVARFQSDKGLIYQVPALQMRYKRVKERLRVWTDTDTSALKQAVEYWENKKWEIIASKMFECGATEKFSAKACERKWQEVEPEPQPLRRNMTVPMMASGYAHSSTLSPPPMTSSLLHQQDPYTTAPYGHPLGASMQPW